MGIAHYTDELWWSPLCPKPVQKYIAISIYDIKKFFFLQKLNLKSNAQFLMKEDSSKLHISILEKISASFE